MKQRGLESSFSSQDFEVIMFEDNPEETRKVLFDVYSALESISREIEEFSTKSFFQQFNFKLALRESKKFSNSFIEGNKQYFGSQVLLPSIFLMTRNNFGNIIF